MSTKFFSLYDFKFWMATSSIGSTKYKTCHREKSQKLKKHRREKVGEPLAANGIKRTKELLRNNLRE